MFRLTQGARAVMAEADAAARRMEQDRLGTAHFLRALCSPQSGTAARALAGLGVTAATVDRSLARSVGGADELGPEDARALRAIGIDLDEIRDRIEAAFGVNALRPAPGRKRPRLTERAKEVWAASVREAQGLGHRWIGSEHLLLGLNDVEAGAAAQILRDAGATAASVRARVLEEFRRAS